LNRYRREVDGVLNDVAKQDDVRFIAEQLERIGTSWSGGTEIDYVTFEDRCRGSSEELRKSQERYVSLFPQPGGIGKILDIGCGRGEMLELLTGAGYDVLGVDPDAGMIEVCRSKGLPVVQDNGIHLLEQTDDNSLKGIFCAQVIEHLLTSEVERLMQLAHQKLLVSGVLVVETINPRSLYALANHFFVDTSHVRPVHPETLRFICEQVGFSRVQLEERSAHPLLETADHLPEGEVGAAVGELLKSVFGYQDYAIVATK
jgi:O-antigen chain-terminating methyltransferase